VQCVVHPIEVVEQTGHGRDLDDLSLIVMRAQSGEQLLADLVRVERQLLCIRQRGLLGIAERSRFKIEEPGQLFLGRPMPRSLRGVRAVSIFAAIDP
jgi:hypothetical protein